MLKSSLMRGKGRRLLIVITVALGASVATSMLSVMFGVGDKVSQELKAYGANIVVRPKGAAVVQDLYHFDVPQSQQSYLSEAELPNIKNIFWTYNILDFSPLLNVSAKTEDGQRLTVVGTWFDKDVVLPDQDSVKTGLSKLRGWWKIDGEWPKDLPSLLPEKDPSGSPGNTTQAVSNQIKNAAAPMPEAIVGQKLAERVKLKIGDKLSVTGPEKKQTVQVSAIVHTGGEEDEQLFTDLSVAQQMIGRPGAVGQVEVSALTTPDNELARKAAKNPLSLTITEKETWYCTAYVSSIAYQIEEVISDSVARPVRQVSESEGTILEKTQLLMVLVTLLAMAGSALAIANLVTANVMDRSREIGLLKAVGGRDVQVAGLVLTEIMVIGLVGGILGYFIGIGLAQFIGQMVFSSSITIVPAVGAIVAALVLIVVLSGSLPAIRYLLRLRPAEVLHGR